jgi:putative ABC transport system permease protein
MQFISKMDLGFKKEGVYNFAVDTEYKNRYQTFREKLKQIPEVQTVSFSNDPPSSENNWQVNFAFDNSPKDADFNSDLKLADGDYIATYGLKLLAGKSYLITDTVRRFVVNETFLKKVGVKNPETAIGKMIKVGGWENFPIVGVVKDFQVGTARDGMKPVIMAAGSKYHWTAGVKLSSTNLSATVSKIEKAYNETFPEVVFNGNFYEDNLNKYYKTEQQLGLLYRIASILSILIACLGVFGLVTFVAEQRVKEIGIRKVLGATIGNITMLISKDFIKLVFVSMLIAFPAAYYLMNKWLGDFAYKINIQWWYFVVAGLLALLITFISVSYQSIKAALMNPVKSLKTE